MSDNNHSDTRKDSHDNTKDSHDNTKDSHNSDKNTPTCEAVEGALTDVLEGRADEALYDHIAECDRCRDARHEAQQAAEQVAQAGDDYQHPDAFEERVLARLDDSADMDSADDASAARVAAGKTEAMSARPVMSAEAAGPALTEEAAEAAEDDASYGSSKLDSLTRTKQATTAAASHAATDSSVPAATPVRGGVLHWLRRPRNTALAGVAAAALAAAVVALAVRPTTPDHNGWERGAAWQGTVAKVRAAGEDGGGLQVCDADGQACKPALAGDTVGEGVQLRTDARTRAHLDMRDGSKLALDRDTVLTLSVAGPRRAKLSQGAVVAEVEKKATGGARFDLPRGHLEVHGTKFALRSMGRVAAVDVSRGSVRLVDEENRGVEVRAGEEGRSYPGVPPYASAAPSLAQAFAWGEGDEQEGPSEALRGLGELRAKKPGSKDERQGAVRLAKHHVKVRISGGFARTEVDEIFQNDTDEVLEGIYRFPLPPDAHIERLALEVDGEMVEGAFVDRDRAAAIWRGAIVNANNRVPRPREEIIWVPGPWKDPALLEWQRGGRFELRIFPIPKRGSRRVILTYTQPVNATNGTRRYVYPLAHDEGGSTRVEDFALDVQVRGYDPKLGVTTSGYEVSEQQQAGAQALRLAERNFTPRGDLVVEYASRDHDSEMNAWAYQPVAKAKTTAKNAAVKKDAVKKDAAAANTRNARKGTDTSLATTAMGAAAISDTSPFITIALRPKLPRAEDNQQRSFAFVVDASRSMFGERYKRASELTARVIGELDRLDRFTVLACDTTCRSLSGGLRAPGYDAAREVRAFLQGITPEGASDPAANVRDAMSQLSHSNRSHSNRSVRLVYIGDGTPTVGQINPSDLTLAARTAVGARGTLTTVAIGSDADAVALRSLARGGGGALVPYVPGRRSSEVAFAILGAAYGAGLRNVQVELPAGLEAVAPEQLDTIVAGGEALVNARMTAPTVSGEVVLRGMVGEQPFEQRYTLQVTASTDSANAFAPRVYAAARIADLELRGDSKARVEAVALSGKYNVASRFTSLLVLESPAMFRAFGLDNVRTVAEWTGETEAFASHEADEADGNALAKKGGFDRDNRAKGKGELAANDPFSVDGTSIGGGGRGMTGAAAGPSPATRPAPMSPPPPAPKPMSPRPRPVDEDSPFGDSDDDFDFDVDASDEKVAKRKSDMSRRPKGQISRKEMERRRRRPRPRPRRGMVPMRRVFERQLNLAVNKLTPTAAAPDKVTAAELALQQSPNRRAALADLFRMYSQTGNLEKAAALATRWSNKEALDPEALTARADIAARRGERDQAIRILGSVVDVRPGDVASHKRLARLHRWAGREALGCRHNLAVSQMRPNDVDLLVEAVFCARRTGEGELAARMMSRASDKVRRGVEAKLRTKKQAKERLRGDLKFVATWEGVGHDLDIALIHPKGHWVSWLGAPTRELISAEDVMSQNREGLALLGSEAGEYVIEIVRAAGSGPVQGKLEVRGPKGVRRTIPFTLQGERVRLGTARVSFRSRLVPVRGGWRR